MTLLRLTEVARRFHTPGEVITALDGVSVTVESGELVGLSGPSGSGKSTLLHLAVGWDRPDGGTITRDPSLDGGWSGIAVVPQDLGLLGELTARQNVELPGRIERLTTDPTELMAALGLDELVDRLPAEMSLGEQQRVAVARGLIATPALLVADEPTAHQDEANVERIVELLRAAALAGSAVIVATHDPRVLALVDRVVELLDGRIVAGDPARG